MNHLTPPKLVGSTLPAAETLVATEADFARLAHLEEGIQVLARDRDLWQQRANRFEGLYTVTLDLLEQSQRSLVDTVIAASREERE